MIKYIIFAVISFMLGYITKEITGVLEEMAQRNLNI